MRLDFVGIILAVFVKTASTIVTYPGTFMCQKNIYLGIQPPAIEIDYYNGDGEPCTSTIHVPSTYYGAIKLRTIDGSCASYLRINNTIYRFCGVGRQSEISLYPNTKVTLQIVNKENDALNDRFNMMVYIYKKQGGYPCDSSNLRCVNRRCLERALFCYEDFNFCNDSTNRDCSDGIEHIPSSPFSSIIAFVALVLPLCLAFIVVGYFCCYRSKRRNRERDVNRSQTRRTASTARDIYSIPTSQDNADSIDYVIDYQKFIEPPPYHSLEMKTMYSETAYAQSIDSCSTRETEMNGTLSAHSPTANAGSSDEIYPNRTYIQANSGADNGARNHAFEPTESELPSYTDVISNEGRFNVDSQIVDSNTSC